MMTPVPVKNIQAFQDEGYQRDLLFLMFLGSVQLSVDLIDPMDAAVVERCNQIRSGTNGGVSFARQLCNYMAGMPYQALFDREKTHSNWDYSFSLRNCVKNGGAVADPDPGPGMVHFNNDPARESRGDAPGGPHPEVCFQILLSDLLVLGLGVGSPTDVPAELVDVVPNGAALDPQFRGQMIQQNYFLRQADTGVAVCRKKQQDSGFTLAFGDPTQQGKDALAGLMTALGPKKPPGAAAAAAALPDPTTACQQPVAGAQKSDAQKNGAPEIATDSDVASANSAVKPVKLTSDRIAFSARSFEGMIYYLGEAARY